MSQWETYQINNVIDIHDIPDSMLVRVIREGSNVKWNYFALKVIITRLNLILQMSSTNGEEELQNCITELRDLLRKSQNVPNAKKDLQTIMEIFGQ